MIRNLFWVVRITFWLFAALVVLLLFVYPLVSSWLINSGQILPGATRLFEPIETAQTWLMRVAGLGWVFFLGSCFASFLNVVAWRVPRGRSVNGSSHCPDCDQQLKFRDNTPIIGWLRCGGKCSNCKLAIPVRYLIVEFVLGSIFLLIAIVQLLSGGWNLPFQTATTLIGFERMVLEPNWVLIATSAYHLTLISVLFTFVLIKIENLRVPYRVWLVGLVFGLAIPCLSPNVNLVSWNNSKNTSHALSVAAKGVDSNSNQVVTNQGFENRSDQFLLRWPDFTSLFVGALMGWLIGTLFVYWQPYYPEHPYVFQPSFIAEEIAAFTLIGIFLGWQSALSIGLISALIMLLRFVNQKVASHGASACIFAATIVHLISWRLLSSVDYWPNGMTSWPVTTGAFALLMALVFVVKSPKLSPPKSG